MEQELLYRFLKCETSASEEERIIAWLESDPEHQKALDKMQLTLEGMALCAPAINRLAIRRPARRPIAHRLVRASMAAASALLLAGAVSYAVISTVLGGWARQNTTVEVPAGQRLSVTLADGSLVWLNAGSRLEYPSIFSGGTRHVKLSGEAMFEIARNEKRPFIVETFACDIEVLGTKFNVESDEARRIFSTALIAGSVRLTSKLNPGHCIVMRPNDEVNLVDGNLLIASIDNPDEYLWPEGIIAIAGYDFEKLMQKFEKTFDVRIEIARKTMPVMNYNRGKIRVSDGVEHALKMLQLSSDFRYQRDSEANTITIH